MRVPRSPEPIGTIDDVRKWIISGTEHEMRFAIQGAARYSIGMIDQLLEDLSYEHAENCDEFLRRWLATLDPLERLAAAATTESHYRLGLLGTARADERAADPDASFTRAYTTQLLGYAEQLREAAEMIRRDVRLVEYMSDEVARRESGGYDENAQPAKIAVAEVLEANPQLRAKIIAD